MAMCQAEESTAFLIIAGLFTDHIPEVFSPRDSSRLAVVVRAVHSSYEPETEPETSYGAVLPFFLGYRKTVNRNVLNRTRRSIQH